MRNCNRENNTPVAKVFDIVYTTCPIQDLNQEASEVISMVNLCEGGGMGGGRIVPSLLLDEPQFYWNVRLVVLGEMRRIEEFKREKKDVK